MSTTNQRSTELYIRSGAPAAFPAAPAPAPVAESLAIHGAGAARSEIVFIVGNVADSAALGAAMGAGKEVHVLDAAGDGLQQMAAILAGREGVDAIHLVSHGAEAALQLGSLTLNAANLAAHSSALATIGAALSADGDLLLYGCDVASGAGADFITRIAELTGADVAASNDLTGSAAMGGDWQLEVVSGDIETAPAVDVLLAQTYQSVLSLNNPSPVRFNTPANFVSTGATGPGSSASSDVVYRLAPGYELRVDGATQAVNSHAPADSYASLNVNGIGNETQVAITFDGGQVFTISSLNVSYSQGDTLAFNAYNSQGALVKTGPVEYIAPGVGTHVVSFTGMTDIAKLIIKPGGGTTAFGTVWITDLNLSNIHMLADTTAPTVSSIVRGGGSVYSNGTSATYNVTFSESVTGVDSNDFSLVTTGTASGTIASVSGSGSSYVVTVNTLAGDGTLGLNLKSSGTGIADTSGNAIAAGYTGQTYTLDHTAPVISSIARAGAASTNATSISYTVTFSESVTGVDAADFSLATSGSAAGSIASVSGSGTTYTVNVNSVSGNGTLRLDLKASGTGIVDVASNAIPGGYTAGQAYTIDNTGPAVTSVSVPADATYGVGQTLSLTVNFNEAVLVTTAGGTPRIALTLDSGTVYANYASGSGSTALTFTYTVASNNLDVNGITIGAMSANGGTLRDAVGNNVILALNSVPSTAGVLVDGVAPTVSSINRVGASTSNASSIDYTVTFSEAVSGVDTGDFQLTPTGTAAGTISAVSGSGSVYTVTVSGVSGDGTLRLDLKSSATGIADTAGNAIAGGYTAGQAYTLDHSAPAVSSVGVPASATYRAGQQLDFTVNFSEAVTVAGGTPSLALTLDTGGTVQAQYVSGSGGSALVFRYTIASGDADANGVTVGALQLNGATLRDGAGNNAGLTLNSVAATSAVLVDGIAPAVLSINRVGAADTNASSVSYVVTFSENISGISAGSFTLHTTGSAAGNIAGVSGSGSSYTVTVNGITGDGDLRLDLKASGTGIVDAAGNAIAGGYTSGQTYTLDHTAPAVASVGVPANATYNSGANLDFTVNFSEAVTVDTTGGTPRIAVTLDGPTTVYASYVSGSGSNALVFRYLVQQGDIDADGVALAGAIDLHGGALRDAAGNSATLALNSVGALAGVLVDATGASVSSIVPASSTPTNGASMVYTVTFSGAVSGVDASDFSLTPSGVGSTASGVIGSVAQVSPSVYTVTVNSLAGDGGLRLDLKASGTSIVDAGNNAAVAGYTGGQAAMLDHTGPQVTAVAVPAAATYASGAALDFTVSFNEAVTVGGAPAIALTLDGGAVVQAQYVSGSGSSALVFRYVVAASDYDADGVSVGTAIALGGGSLQDALGNNATLTLNGVASSAAVLISGAGPAISSIVPNATPSSASSVAYTVTFSRDVSGVDSTDFALHATGTAAGTVASVAAVPGSNRAYVVTVNGVSGDGTLRLDLAASGTGITDTLGHVIAAGGYTAGQAATIDHTAPTATVVLGSSSLSAGQTALLTVTFSEAVTQFSNADLTVGSGSVGTLSSSDGGITWTGVFTPTTGVQASANVITLNTTTLTDLAGNAGTLSVQSNSYSVDTIPVVVPPVVTPPVTPGLPVTPGVSTVDGVTLVTSVGIDPLTGRSTSTVVIPVITQTRPDDPGSPNATLADIPLGLTTNGVTAGLTVSLPVGSGLQVEGSTSLLNRSDGLLDLIRRIEQKTVAGSSVQNEMTGTGTDFLAGLFSGVLLQSMTVTPTVTTAPGAATTILINGSSTTPAAGTSNASAIGLVIDAHQLSANTVLQLNNVDFAAVVGAATLRGGDGQNIVVGDDAAQNILLGADDDQLFGGAGDDVIGSAGGDDLLDGGSGNDIVVGGIGNDTLRGGTGNDVLQGGRSDSGAWTFMLDASGQLTARHQTALFAPAGSETLTAAELDAARPELGFLGASQAKLLQLAGIYQAAFGRVADVPGLTFWATGSDSLLGMVKGFMLSPEWLASGYDQLDDRAFVETLYQKALGRNGDAAGVTFWLDALNGANGTQHSRAEVLLGFAQSAELQGKLVQNGSVSVAAANLTQESGWIGGSGNDRLDGGAGSDILVGGDGVDTIVYSGRLNDYRIELASDGRVLVADKANTDVDTISGIELGAFADGTVSLGFTQASVAQLKLVGLLYQAVLDRAGDMPGFVSWIDQHLSTAQLVSGFTHSDEFKARYDGVSNAQFVASLYQNSGIASNAAGGQESWVSYLDSHTREELVARWIDTEVVGQAQFAGNGLWLV